jgi:hypothetical protein
MNRAVPPDESQFVRSTTCGDETFIPAHAQKIPNREREQGDIFYKGRNFRQGFTT